MLALLLPLLLGQYVTPAAQPILPWRPHQARAAAPPVWDVAEVLAAPPVANTDVCGLVAGEMTGAWWCLRGDGTLQPGTVTALSVQGSPAPVAQTLAAASAPQGLAAQWLNGASTYYRSADVASPAGSFSVGVLLTADTLAGDPRLVTRDSNAAGKRMLDFYVTSNGTAGALLYKADATSSGITSAANTVAARAPLLLVLTYRYVTDGTSELILYAGGAQVAQTATAVGPMQAGLEEWYVGRREFAGFEQGLAGNVAAAFFTEKVLTAATVRTLAEAVQPPLRDSQQRRLAVTRTGAASFEDAAGRTGWVLANQPRLTRGALLVEAPATNIVLHSSAFGNAAWTATGLNGVVAPSVTSQDTVFAPDGSRTADVWSFPACLKASSHVAVVSQAVTASNATYTNALWMKVPSGTATIYMWDNSGDTLGTACSLTTTWQRCSFAHNPGGASSNFRFGVDLRRGDQPSDTPAMTVHTWQAQQTLGTSLTSDIPTEGTPVVRANDDVRWHWGRTNYLTYSQDTTQAAWSSSNATLAYATADTAAPDGTATATRVTATGAGAVVHWTRNVAPTNLTAGRRYMWSAFVKEGTARYAYLARAGFWQALVVDARACQVVAQTADANAGNATRFAPRFAFARALGNGWCRAGFVGAAEATNDILYLGPLPAVPALGAGTAPTYTQAGETLYLWGASVSGWDSVDTDLTTGEYIPTAAAAVTVYPFSRAALAASGEAQVDALFFATTGSDMAALGVHQGDRTLAFGNALGRFRTFLPGNVQVSTGPLLLGAWAVGRVVWSQAFNAVTVQTNGGFDTRGTWTDAFGGNAATSTYVRLGNNAAATSPANVYLRNVRLRVVP